MLLLKIYPNLFVLSRPIGGRRQRPNRLSNNEAEVTAVEEKKEVPGEDL